MIKMLLVPLYIHRSPTLQQRTSASTFLHSISKSIGNLWQQQLLGGKASTMQSGRLDEEAMETDAKQFSKLACKAKTTKKHELLLWNNQYTLDLNTAE